MTLRNSLTCLILKAGEENERNTFPMFLNTRHNILSAQATLTLTRSKLDDSLRREIVRVDLRGGNVLKS